MFKIELFELGHCSESEYTRVICVSHYQGKFIFSYNKKRNGWEIPGGHIEEGESWKEAALRELYEETGATEADVKPICVYKINSYGLLCYCEISKMEKLPENFEMSEIMLSEELPNDLTFPETYNALFERTKEYMEENQL